MSRLLVTKIRTEAALWHRLNWSRTHGIISIDLHICALPAILPPQAWLVVLGTLVRYLIRPAHLNCVAQQHAQIRTDITSRQRRRAPSATCVAASSNACQRLDVLSCGIRWTGTRLPGRRISRITEAAGIIRIALARGTIWFRAASRAFGTGWGLRVPDLHRSKS